MDLFTKSNTLADNRTGEPVQIVTGERARDHLTTVINEALAPFNAEIRYFMGSDGNIFQPPYAFFAKKEE